MKVRMKRYDDLRGERYIVSAHLLEGTAADDVKLRFPIVSRIVTKDGEEPVKQEILKMFQGAGYAVETWDGTLFGADTALLTYGNMGDAEADATALGAVGGSEACVHIWWQSVPEAVFDLPRAGMRPLALTFCDPTIFGKTHGRAWERAILLALRLGVLLDRGLFDLVYADFDPVTLCTRGCRLVSELVAGDPNVRDRMTFGETYARVYGFFANGELTKTDCLALGMQHELSIGAARGICNPRRIEDFYGALAYYGFPSGMDVTDEEMEEAERAILGSAPSIKLLLPVAVGKCREKEIKL